MNMQDKEIRAQSRARYEAAEPLVCEISKGRVSYGGELLIRTVMQDSVAALDYIEQLEASLTKAEAAMDAMRGAKHHWKARAEALEKAILLSGNFFGDNYAPCTCCVKFPKTGEKDCASGMYSLDKSKCWQFDQARFSDKPTPCQEGDE